MPLPDTGAALARAFCLETVLPALAAALDGVPIVAGLLGAGSEVVGRDDAVSRDHDWGPRATVLVPPDRIDDALRALDAALPTRFRGLPVRYPTTGDPVARHRVEVAGLEGFLRARLGFDPRGAVTVEDWLAVSGQAVLEVTAGPVFADPEGALADVRRRLRWYPPDVWRVAAASDWLRLDEELPLMGRAGETGDEAGSRIIAARLVRTAMHLALLLERRWAPYPKWFGAAFAALSSAPALTPGLRAALEGPGWQARQAGFADLLEGLRVLQESAGLGAPGRAAAPFHDRPFIRVDPALPAGLLDGVADPAVRAVVPLGTAEQRTDVVQLLVDPVARRELVRAG